MRFIADLHIHSKYARAVSPRMTLPELDRWADDKGIQVMGTGDFTHPLWFAEMEKQLEPDFADSAAVAILAKEVATTGKPASHNGLYRLKAKYKLPTIKGTRADTRFLLTTEVACIYTRGGKGRRVHSLIFAPDLASAKKINEGIAARGCNLRSDGRPILGLDIVEVLKIVLAVHPEAVLVPAHIWTPWFALFGSKSGFNSIEECFGDFSKYIFAMETGLSSDPVMNWRWSALDKIALISNSDSHSLERIGREANIFDTELSYGGIMDALKGAAGRSFGVPQDDTTGGLADAGAKHFVATIEYFPEEGMYHVDGHRKCGVSYDPATTRKQRGLCRECGKPVTVGVLNRLDKLADRAEAEVVPVPIKIGEVMGKGLAGRVPFINLVTLDSIIGEAFDVGVKSKKVKAQYDLMIKAFGNELDILMTLPLSNLSTINHNLSPSIVEGIRRMREGRLHITPGFDGQYGEVHIFDKEEKKVIRGGGAKALFEL